MRPYNTLHSPFRKQLSWRLSDEPVGPSTDPDHVDPVYRQAIRTRIFLGYTSNLVSAGTREQIRCDACIKCEIAPAL